MNQPTDKNQTTDPAWFRRHDLITMRQVWAKLDEASELLANASLCFDDIPAEVATHDGQNVPEMVDEAVATIARALNALRGAMDAR